MNCADIRKFLHAHADGELDIANSLELERHLKTCAACAAENNSLQSLRAALRDSDLAYRAPKSLQKKVRQIARPADAEIPPREISWPWPWKWLAAGATALAVLTIFLRPAGISEHDQLLNEAVAAHIRSLQAEHLTDVASSDQHTVKPWFDGKLDFAPDVRDFAAQNFPLVGGRLDYLNSHAVAALVYRHNKHLINVFVWPVKNSETVKSGTANRRGYFLLNREANGLYLCLVSDLNEKELADLASLIGK